MRKLTFHDPGDDFDPLYEIADVIRRALADVELIRLANDPDHDKSSRVQGRDTPETAHMRCVAAEAVEAVFNRLVLTSVDNDEVVLTLKAVGHADDMAIARAQHFLGSILARRQRRRRVTDCERSEIPGDPRSKVVALPGWMVEGRPAANNTHHKNCNQLRPSYPRPADRLQ